jgi:hypothetical protein
VVKFNAGARLVMERASFSLGRQTPARRSTLIPSTSLRGTRRAAALRSFYTVCVVSCYRTTYFAPTRQPSAVTFARALAMKCSIPQRVTTLSFYISLFNTVCVSGVHAPPSPARAATAAPIRLRLPRLALGKPVAII